jgi:hypothetical protein
MQSSVRRTHTLPPQYDQQEYHRQRYSLSYLTIYDPGPDLQKLRKHLRVLYLRLAKYHGPCAISEAYDSLCHNLLQHLQYCHLRLSHQMLWLRISIDNLDGLCTLPDSVAASDGGGSDADDEQDSEAPLSAD